MLVYQHHLSSTEIIFCDFSKLATGVFFVQQAWLFFVDQCYWTNCCN